MTTDTLASPSFQSRFLATKVPVLKKNGEVHDHADSGRINDRDEKCLGKAMERADKLGKLTEEEQKQMNISLQGIR